MSDTRQECSSEATQIESQAADWLERKVGGPWEEKDQAALGLWLAEAPAHRLAFLRLSAAWSYADRLTALKPSAPEQIVVPARRNIRPLLMRVSAVLVAMAVLGGIAASVLLNPGTMTYSTGFGSHKKIILADGSQVELNANTVLRVAASRNRRVAWLDKGEVFFQISRDLNRPFVVLADNRRVTVLGTKFVVRRDTDRLEVAVVEGRVRLDAANKQTHLQPTLLMPGDAAVATSHSLSVAKRTEQAFAEQLSWRSGVLIFDNKTLAEAAAEFNRYNRDKLVIVDPAVARLTIGGTFPMNNVKLFARVTRDVLGLRVESRGDEEVISR